MHAHHSYPNRVSFIMKQTAQEENQRERIKKKQSQYSVTVCAMRIYVLKIKVQEKFFECTYFSLCCHHLPVIEHHFVSMYDGIFFIYFFYLFFFLGFIIFFLYYFGFVSYVARYRHCALPIIKQFLFVHFATPNGSFWRYIFSLSFIYVCLGLQHYFFFIFFFSLFLLMYFMLCYTLHRHFTPSNHSQFTSFASHSNFGCNSSLLIFLVAFSHSHQPFYSF